MEGARSLGNPGRGRDIESTFIFAFDNQQAVESDVIDVDTVGQVSPGVCLPEVNSTFKSASVDADRRCQRLAWSDHQFHQPTRGLVDCSAAGRLTCSRFGGDRHQQVWLFSKLNFAEIAHDLRRTANRGRGIRRLLVRIRLLCRFVAYQIRLFRRLRVRHGCLRAHRGRQLRWCSGGGYLDLLSLFRSWQGCARFSPKNTQCRFLTGFDRQRFGYVKTGW